MAGRCRDGSAGDEAYEMAIEGSRQGRMGMSNYGGQGSQRAAEPRSK